MYGYADGEERWEWDEGYGCLVNKKALGTGGDARGLGLYVGL